MFYLIYVSSAVELMPEAALHSLLEQSRANNRRLDITGMLLYQGGNFMQMLEGEQQTVLELYDRRKKDKRHTGMIKIMTGQAEKRSFEQWSMGFKNMDNWGNSQTLDEYIDKNLVMRSFAQDTQDAYRFMRQFQARVR